MSLKNRFLRYLYTSSALNKKNWDDLKTNQGIFQLNFYENPVRKGIIESIITKISLSSGGVFFLSGYRGIGKTSILNYVFDEMRKIKEDNLIIENININTKAMVNLEQEIINRIVFTIDDKKLAGIKLPVINRRFNTLGRILPGHRIRVLKKLKDNLLWMIEKSYSPAHIGGGNDKVLQMQIDPLTISKKSKENPFYIDHLFTKLIKRMQDELDYKMVFVLDELDKLPFLYGEKKSTGDDSRQNENMEWLLNSLGAIKHLLFESGIIFVFVVNKDVYDYWETRSSRNDLFKNVITSLDYMPCYFKNEMRLNTDFQIMIDPEAVLPYPYSNHNIKEFFFTCSYYESYANPRSFFQLLSGKIVNNRLFLSQDDSLYLIKRILLFEMDDLLYNYTVDGHEASFRRLDYCLNDLLLIKDDPAHHLNAFFTQYFKGSDRISTENLRLKYNAMMSILKSHDPHNNFPVMNYFIRRVTDFLLVLEKSTYYNLSDLKKFKKSASECANTGYESFISLVLIPLTIIVLVNNNRIRIDKTTIIYDYPFGDNLQILREVSQFESEMKFEEALKKYDEYLDKDPKSQAALHKKLRCIYYAIRCGISDVLFHKCKIQWKEALLSMKAFLDEQIHHHNRPDIADYYFFVYIYVNSLATAKEGEIFKNYLLIDDANDRKCLLLDNNELQEHILSYAESIYKESINNDPLNATLKLWLGYIYYWQKRYGAALLQFQDAYALHRNPVTFLRILDTLVNMGNPAKAIEWLIKDSDICITPLQKKLLNMAVTNLFILLWKREKKKSAVIIKVNVGLNVRIRKLFEKNIEYIVKINEQQGAIEEFKFRPGNGLTVKINTKKHAGHGHYRLLTTTGDMLEL